MEPLENLCPRCGEPYSDRGGRLRCLTCGYIKPEKATKEEEVLLATAAQKLRLGDFDEAKELYADILETYPKNAEAHWGVLLCEYGIKYENDYDGKKVATCYSTRYESLYVNPHYAKAIELAEDAQREYYASQAAFIEQVRKEWIEKASKEKPYDIFISYRDMVDGKRTEDSYGAHELYNHLTGLGYHVFFSRVTLKGKTGENYEPYIFNALNTAKAMLVYASKPEYVTSTWVKNEWTRYLARIKAQEKRPDSLCLIVNGFDPAALPLVLRNRQVLKAGELTFIKDLEAYLEKTLRAPKKVLPGKQKEIDQKVRKPSEGSGNGRKGKKKILIGSISAGVTLAVVASLAWFFAGDPLGLFRPSAFSSSQESTYISNPPFTSSDEPSSQSGDASLPSQEPGSSSEDPSLDTSEPIESSIPTGEFLVKNLNTQLRMKEVTEGKNKTMKGALDDVFEIGYSMADLTPDNGCEIVWNQDNDEFSLRAEAPLTDAYKFWKIYDSYASIDNTYSAFLNQDDYSGEINVMVGFDCGNNFVAGAVNYHKGVEPKGDVRIRTAGPNAVLFVDADTDTLTHFGFASVVTIENIGAASYHEAGTIKELIAKKGHVIVENSGAIMDVKAFEGSTATYYVEHDGIVLHADAGTIEKTEVVQDFLTIGTREQLEAFRDATNSGMNFAGKTITLTSDIHLIEGWKPISNYSRTISSTSSDLFFAGTFDGAGHTISGLTNQGLKLSEINTGANSTTVQAVEEYTYGLFACVKDATIKDLRLTGVDIRDLRLQNGEKTMYGDNVGALAGYVFEGGLINGVQVEGSVACFDSVGGIIGSRRTINLASNDVLLIVSNCENKASITAVRRPAGILGQIAGKATINNNINGGNIVSTGTTTNSADGYCTAAGIAHVNGWQNTDIVFSGNTNSGEVSATNAHGSIAVATVGAVLQGLDTNGHCVNENGVLTWIPEYSTFEDEPTLSNDGKTVTYGLYPQTRVSDPALLASLESLASPETNGWYLYQGEYYAKASAIPWDGDYVFDDGARIYFGDTYWFKCEPIVWNVLNHDNGTYFVLSSVLLDVHMYDDDSNNYADSEIRSWLNDDFYSSAFFLNNSHILTTTVDNSAATTDWASNPYESANTQDRVYLPSYRDYLKSDYGFAPSTGSTSTRYCKTTDWARARGAWSYISSDGIQSNGYYWTRSPYSGHGVYSWLADYDGSLGYVYVNNLGNGHTYGHHSGVRPALTLKLS